MIPIGRGVPSGTENAVYTLLNLLAPEKAEARRAALDELVKARDDAVAAITRANEADAKNQQQAAELKKDRAEAAAVIAQADAIKLSNENRTRELAAQQDALNAATADHAAAVQAFTKEKAVHDAAVRAFKAILEQVIRAEEGRTGVLQ